MKRPSHEPDPMLRFRGQTLVEYGLLLALIVLIVLAALWFLGPIANQLF